MKFLLRARPGSEPLLRTLLCNTHTSICWVVRSLPPFSDEKQRHKEMPQNTVNITLFMESGIMTRTHAVKGELRIFTTAFYIS